MDIVNFTTPDHPLRQPILDLVWAKYLTTPRHIQVELGPSEIGEECVRKLAYKIMDHPVAHRGSDPLPSIIGTAAHSWMEAACREWNDKAGKQVWVPETELNITKAIVGHCDAYYWPTRTVVDWKFPGQESMMRYRKNGPSQLYRVQAHLYGMAWRNRDVPVETVAIVFFPRGGLLSGMHIWSEPYDESVADTALRRYYQITEVTTGLKLDEHPENYRLLPDVPGHHCTYCSYFRPGPDTGDGCPGYTKEV